MLQQQRLSNNHQPLFSDEELLTIYLFGHMQGLTTQRRIYDYIRNHWREWSPALPAYQSVNCRLNELAPAFELLITELLTTQAWQIKARDDRLIDSVPVMLARGTRANRASVAPELADTGFAPPDNSITAASNCILSLHAAPKNYLCRRRFICPPPHNMTFWRCAK